MKIVFATNNLHKLFEVKKAVPASFEILSLKDIQCFDEIPETCATLQGNALQKAQYVKDHYHYDCFADDTGLEIDALNGRPGVYSARYAGPEADFEKNMNKVLEEMKDQTNRKARFRTVIALLLNGKEHFFEGTVEGEILKQKQGNEGFGYDPVFRPDGFTETFAQMDVNLKNRISHRGKAVQKLLEYLKSLQT